MVFQRPNPFPLSVRKNITFGLEIHNKHDKEQHDAIVEASLKDVLLWDDLHDRPGSFCTQALARTAATLMHRPCAGNETADHSHG